MPSPSQVKATQKYISTHYDRIVLTMSKGEKEKIKAAAGKQSLNSYIFDAIQMRIDAEKGAT